MITAAFDTSVGLAIAIAEGDEILLQNSAGQTTGRRANDMADWLLKNLERAHVRPAEITRWTVGTGPGSFVGLRCGMALVKGICTQSAAQVRGLPSSLAVALTPEDDELPKSHTRIAVLNDARQGEVILSLYEQKDYGLAAVGDAKVMTPEELDALADGKTAFVSVQADILADRLTPNVQTTLIYVNTPAIAKLIAPKGWPWPATSEDIERTTEPVYVRPPVFVQPRAI